MACKAAAIVLIHGSWLGGWCWRAVADRLASSFRVLTPTLTGLGDRAHLASEAIDPAVHVRDVVETLAVESDLEQQRIVLVGHSYGSMVAHGLLEPLGERVAGLIVVDGFLAEPHRSVFELRPDIEQMFEPHRLPDRPWLVAPPIAEHLGMDDPAAARAAHRKLRPLPIGTHSRGVDFSPAMLERIPRSFVNLSRFGLLNAEAEAAERRGWRRVDVDAFHFAMLSAPALLAESIAGLVEVAATSRD